MRNRAASPPATERISPLQDATIVEERGYHKTRLHPVNLVAILNTQFVQVALPLMITLALAAWINNKSLDGLGKRIDESAL